MNVDWNQFSQNMQNMAYQLQQMQQQFQHAPAPPAMNMVQASFTAPSHTMTFVSPAAQPPMPPPPPPMQQFQQSVHIQSQAQPHAHAQPHPYPYPQHVSFQLPLTQAPAQFQAPMMPQISTFTSMASSAAAPAAIPTYPSSSLSLPCISNVTVNHMDHAMNGQNLAQQLNSFAQQMVHYGQAIEAATGAFAQQQQQRQAQVQQQVQGYLPFVIHVNNGVANPPPPPLAQPPPSHASNAMAPSFVIDLTDEKKHNESANARNRNQNRREESPVFVPWSDDDVPHRYKCPISLEIMRVPVLCSDGFYYDRQQIFDWLMTSNRSPMTNLAIENPTLVPDDVLRTEITQWIAKQWSQFHCQCGDAEHGGRNNANSNNTSEDDADDDEDEEGSYADDDYVQDEEDVEDQDEDVIMLHQHPNSQHSKPNQSRHMHNGNAYCKKKI